MTGSPEISDLDEMNSVFNMEVEKPKIMLGFQSGSQSHSVMYMIRGANTRMHMPQVLQIWELPGLVQK